MSDFPSRLASDYQTSREQSCLSNESASFNAFGKKPPKLEVQANLHAAINFRQEVAAIPFKKIFHFGNSQRVLLHSFRKHKMNDDLFHNLITFPSCFQDDFNLENVKHSATRYPAVYSNFFNYA